MKISAIVKMSTGEIVTLWADADDVAKYGIQAFVNAPKLYADGTAIKGEIKGIMTQDDADFVTQF